MISKWKEFTLKKVESALNGIGEMSDFKVVVEATRGDSVPKASLEAKFEAVPVKNDEYYEINYLDNTVAHKFIGATE